MSYPPPSSGSAHPYPQQPPQQQSWPVQSPPGVPPAGQGQWPPHPPGGGTGGSGGRRTGGILLMVFGLLLLCGGGGLAALEYSEPPKTVGNPKFGPSLWRDTPIDKLFPEAIGGYGNTGVGLYDAKQATWNRVGISPDTECDKGLTNKVLKVAKENGCKAVMRATYVDHTGNMVSTVALVVMERGTEDDPPKDRLAGFVEEDEAENEGAIAPYAVPGTLAAKWESRNGRQLLAVPFQPAPKMPYVVGATIGSVDGAIAGGDLPDKWAEISGGVDSDRESWNANADELASLYSAHITNIMAGDAK
ncbi:hypothetical protein [Streptomyces luteolus]|uniref:Uncharacterized protein n=1 Tax=Streptomyces luteolus TaxID=3043615 RepID=A0ABT6T489_9ACTN|nr:hypothetical protein [Streptomyces sp. B-S-A12]MDI3422688.1 hypothetical protein [Streptomyces sp. B-S-A12]